MIFFPKVGYVIVPWNITTPWEVLRNKLPVAKSTCGMDWWLKCDSYGLMYFWWTLIWCTVVQDKREKGIESFDGFVWLKFILICRWKIHGLTLIVLLQLDFVFRHWVVVQNPMAIEKKQRNKKKTLHPTTLSELACSCQCKMSMFNRNYIFKF